MVTTFFFFEIYHFPTRTELLEHIYQVSINSIGHVSSIVQHIFERCLQPYVHILNQWLFEGIVNDNFEDALIITPRENSHPKVKLRNPPVTNSLDEIKGRDVVRLRRILATIRLEYRKTSLVH